MTVILILLCLAIAGRELYIASDKRLPRVQAEIAELRSRLDERDEVLAELQDRLALAAAAQRSAAGGAGTVMAAAQGTPSGPMADDPMATWAIDELAKRVEELSVRMHDARERLTELERHRTHDRRAHDELAGSLESTRALLGQVHRHLLDRLDQAAEAELGAGSPAIVRGTLRGMSSASRQAMIRAYDRLAAAEGLRVELREVMGGAPWQVRYFVTGPEPRELERDFIELLGGLRAETGTTAASGTSVAAGTGLAAGTGASPSAGEGAAAVRSLLLGLDGGDGGTAQLGPLLVVAVPDALLCGVLPLADLHRDEIQRLAADPAAAAGRLRALPESRWCDLTGLRREATARGTSSDGDAAE